MEFYISKGKIRHNAVILKNGNEIYNQSLIAFIGSNLPSVLKIDVKEVNKYGFITYKVLNPEEVIKILKDK